MFDLLAGMRADSITNLRNRSVAIRSAIAFGDWTTTNAITRNDVPGYRLPNMRLTNLCEDGKHDVCFRVYKNLVAEFNCKCLCHN